MMTIMSESRVSAKMEIIPKCLNLRKSQQKEKQEKLQLLGDHFI